MKKVILACLAAVALLAGVMVQQLNQRDFTTLDGEHYRWQALHGQWVVVNYFAKWCAPCLREIPELNLFHQRHPHIPLFALSYDPLDKEQLLTLKNEFAIDVAIISEIESLPWGQMPAALPHTIIIDPSGHVVKHLSGEQSADSLYAELEKLEGF
ncbi:MAG: TlpA family protein disulfide reductase [Paraglaciecola sp.]|nr:TlpA family protein disulfide reductase [Paraglaciecola sp.]NCT47049.1 TlpA family protein disulfide reductase [Paraglaciecola sp.]